MKENSGFPSEVPQDCRDWAAHAEWVQSMKDSYPERVGLLLEQMKSVQVPASSFRYPDETDFPGVIDENGEICDDSSGRDLFTIDAKTGARVLAPSPTAVIDAEAIREKEQREYDDFVRGVRDAYLQGFIGRDEYVSVVGRAPEHAPLDNVRISARFDKSLISVPGTPLNYLANIETFKRVHSPAGAAVYYPGGVKVIPHNKPQGAGGKTGGGRRGSITGFSADSARRMRDLLMKIDWSNVVGGKRSKLAKSFFITLTYGEVFPTEFEHFKGDLRAFRERLTRLVSSKNSYGAVWKLEMQKRGAPHYHLTVFFERDVNAKWFLHWVARAWSQIVSRSMGYSKEYQETVRRVHLGEIRGTGKCVLPVHAAGGIGRLMTYLTKYMGKEFEAEPDFLTGRVWGVWNKDNLPLVIGIVIKFNRQEWHEFVQAVNERGELIGSQYLQTLDGRLPFTLSGDYFQFMSRFASCAG